MESLFMIEGVTNSGFQADLVGEDASRKGSPKELKKAVAEFESLFIYQMLKIMRETVMKSDLFPSSRQKDIYTSMVDMELSRALASGEGLGLGRILLEQLSRFEGIDVNRPGAGGPLRVSLPRAVGEYRKGLETNPYAASGKVEGSASPNLHDGKDAGGVER